VRFALVFAAVCLNAAEDGYIDPLSCRSCHREIHDSYAATGMGRSFAPASQIPALPRFSHAASDREYSIVNRGGAAFLRRAHAYGVVEKRIDYVLGSGNHSKTFVHRDERGRLWELPVSWYAEKGGSWAMSPGYDRPDHSDFRRELSASCLFCHNGYPSSSNGGLASGIDCQRCHGPGKTHVESKGAIVNPAKRSRDRQMDVCLQCHLESASRTLPEAIRRFGREPFSFRPGEALGNFKLYFQFAGKSQSDDRITVNNAGFELRQSACFRKSPAMTCTTCHNPHAALRGSQAEQRYTAICRSCHASVHESKVADCSSCHMPKRRTEDAVHVIMTDHRIRRRLPPGDLLAERSEWMGKSTGRVELLDPQRLPRTPESRLYQALAQIDVSDNVRDVTRELEQAVEQVKPAQSWPYRVLGQAYRKTGRMDEAIAAMRKALRHDPADSAALVAMAELLSERGRSAEATALLEPAVKQRPDDVALHNALAVVYAGQSRFADAIELLSSALRVWPDDPVSWLNLGVCLQAKGDRRGAESAYRQALLLQPDLAKAREYLQALDSPKRTPAVN
jgi:predicted CXXCH cytochrome family protein